MVTVHNKVDAGNIVFTINTLIYPLAVIMKTAYNYTDNFYIFLDYINDGIIEVQIKSKECIDIAELESLVGDFYNELLNQNIRLDIQKNTSNLRQLILGRALYTECIENKEIELIKDTQLDTTNVEIIINEDYNSDLYQISAPWTSKMEYKGDD